MNRCCLESVIESRLPISKNLGIDSRCFFDGARRIIVRLREGIVKKKVMQTLHSRVDTADPIFR